MRTPPDGATVAGVEHHQIEVNGTTLHYVSAGASGSPVLLVHGFPETWWAFRSVIPLLAATHRVYAVDLRGFGDSSAGGDDFDSATAAADLHALVGHLDVGPVHVSVQDVSGATGFRFVANHPADVRSLVAVETALAGFGGEALADVRHGGVWYIGALAAPGVPDLLFAGRAREFVGDYLYPLYGVTPPALTQADVDEYARTYDRDGGFRGAAGLYASLLTEGGDLVALARAKPVQVPVLAIGSSGGSFTADALRDVTAGEVRTVRLDGVGHYVAQQAPEKFAEALLGFVDGVDSEVEGRSAP